jgi:hypothetical protein
MPKIKLPADLAEEWREAYRWYPSSPEMALFLDQVREGYPWSERRPRWLLAWAAEHAIQTFGHRRFVLMVNAGFLCPGCWRLWRAAAADLRRCHAKIQSGEEDGLAYAGNHPLLSFADEPPRRWGATERETAMTAMVFPSFAGPAPEAAGAPPPPAAPSGGPSAPLAPLGQWLTR